MTNVVLVGGDKLAAELGAASRTMLNLSEPLRDAGKMVLDQAKATSPRRTGRMAGSHRTETGPTRSVVSAHTVYAPVIHWGWRAHSIEPSLWLTKAAQATEPRWVAGFERYIDQTLSKVEGIPH